MPVRWFVATIDGLALGRVAVLLVTGTGAVGALPAAPQADAALAEIAQAQKDAGADPKRALQTLRALRTKAVASGSLLLRLEADDAECRLSTDLDAAAAQAVAAAGLEAAGVSPQGGARQPWLRLRACRAGLLAEAGAAEAADAQLDELMALTQGEGDARERAIVMLTRGVQRSRTGRWDEAQQDLMRACALLEERGPEVDRELCLGHLANHFRRVGDSAEALHVLLPLAEAARQRGAIFDLSIYAVGIGQALQAQGEWAGSIGHFEEAARISEQLGDPLGQAYAENDLAVSLLELHRGEEALSYIDRALGRVGADADPRQHEVALVTQGEALLATGQAARALAVLVQVEPAVRRRGDLELLAVLLRARAGAMRAAGRWDEAFDAMDEATRVGSQLHARRLSVQSARLRLQYQRARDTAELQTLRQLGVQQQQLRRTEAAVLALSALLLGIAVWVAVRKVRHARRLQALATTDDLTGIANRRALMATATQAVEEAERRASSLAMLMIDVDHFKRVNDRHGHAVGDRALCHVTRLLAAALRDQDRLGRVGGEEFAAVLPGATVEQASAVAERMRRAIASSPMDGPQGELPITVSIGIAGARAGDTAELLLSRADAALFRAKACGRNVVVADDGTPATELV